MATVSKELAQQIIAQEGQYKGDPPVHQVVRYQNYFNTECWAILYAQDVASDRYAETEYVRNPQVVWQFKG
jgi:hypothetical protein